VGLDDPLGQGQAKTGAFLPRGHVGPELLELAEQPGFMSWGLRPMPRSGTSRRRLSASSGNTRTVPRLSSGENFKAFDIAHPSRTRE